MGSRDEFGIIPVLDRVTKHLLLFLVKHVINLINR